MVIGDKVKWGRQAAGATEVPLGMSPGVLGGPNCCKVETWEACGVITG